MVLMVQICFARFFTQKKGFCMKLQYAFARKVAAGFLAVAVAAAGAASGLGAGREIGAGKANGADFGWIPRARMGALRFQSCAEARSKDEATRVVPKDKLANKKALFRVFARWIFDKNIT